MVEPMHTLKRDMLQTLFMHNFTRTIHCKNSLLRQHSSVTLKSLVFVTAAPLGDTLVPPIN